MNHRYRSLRAPGIAVLGLILVSILLAGAGRAQAPGSEGEAILTRLRTVFPSPVLDDPVSRPWIPVSGIALGIQQPELELYVLESPAAARAALARAPLDPSGASAASPKNRSRR